MDVYSFGVVMLEIATGSRAYVDSRQPHSLVEFSTQASENVDDLGLCELSDRRSPCCTGKLFSGLIAWTNYGLFIRRGSPVFPMFIYDGFAVFAEKPR